MFCFARAVLEKASSLSDDGRTRELLKAVCASNSMRFTRFAWAAIGLCNQEAAIPDRSQRLIGAHLRLCSLCSEDSVLSAHHKVGKSL